MSNTHNNLVTTTPPAPGGAPAVSRPHTPAAPASEENKSDDASLASIVDTIEAVLVALILALTFRAFVVEAFVIPTGSMAPTLLGAHFDVICPKCGYAFKRDANLRVQYVAGSGVHPAMVGYVGERAELVDSRSIPSDENAPVICPNCQYPIDPSAFPQRLASRVVRDDRPAVGGAVHPVSFAWANNGDRILVMKYLYAVLEPSRFDVIVFKEPMHGQDNYIKRLIGLPGVTIDVVDGDIFVGKPGQVAPTDLLFARMPPYVQ